MFLKGFLITLRINIQKFEELFWKKYSKKSFIYLFLSKEVFRMYFI